MFWNSGILLASERKAGTVAPSQSPPSAMTSSPPTVEPVLDMRRQLVEGDVCGGLVGCVVGKELAAVVEADDATHVANGAELVVGKVAFGAANRTGVGVAGDEGTRGAGGGLVKALIVEVGDVEHHAGVLHLRKRLDAGGGEAGVGVVAARERPPARSS